MPSDRRIRGQFLRYCTIGAGNTLLDFGIYAVLTRSADFWRIHYLAANAVSFVIVVSWSFFWNKRWSFREYSPRFATQYVRFVSATLVGIIISESVLWVGVEFFDLPDLVAKVIAGPLVVAWNFTAYRFWAFRVSALPASYEIRPSGN